MTMHVGPIIRSLQYMQRASRIEENETMILESSDLLLHLGMCEPTFLAASGRAMHN